MAIAFNTNIGAPVDSTLVGYQGQVVLSDGVLAVVIAEYDGATFDFCIWTSADGGATWTKRLTVLSAQPLAYYYPCWVRDTLFIFYGRGTTGVAGTLEKVTYAGGTFTHVLSGVSILAASGTDSYAGASFGVEPGGTVWSVVIGTDAFGSRAWVLYSSDGGATWTSSIDLVAASTYGVVDGRPYVFCCELSTIVVLSRYVSTTINVSYYTRLHSDAKGTWAAEQVLYTTTGTTAPQIFAGPMYGDPFKRIMVAGVDKLATPDVVFGYKLSESALGVWSAVAFGTFNNDVDATTRIGIMGFSSGWKVYYPKAGVTDALYYREFPSVATAWPAEQSIAVPDFPNNSSFQGTIQASDAYDAAVHFALFRFGLASPRYMGCMYEGLMPRTPFDEVIPASSRMSLELDALIPAMLRMYLALETEINIHGYLINWVQSESVFPISSRLQAYFDTFIPIVNRMVFVAVDADAIIPIMARAGVYFDSDIPYENMYFDAWLKEGSLGDAWVKDTPLIDTWTKELAGADLWTKE